MDLYFSNLEEQKQKERTAWQISDAQLVRNMEISELRMAGDINSTSFDTPELQALYGLRTKEQISTGYLDFQEHAQERFDDLMEEYHAEQMAGERLRETQEDATKTLSEADREMIYTDIRHYREMNDGTGKKKDPDPSMIRLGYFQDMSRKQQLLADLTVQDGQEEMSPEAKIQTELQKMELREAILKDAAKAKSLNPVDEARRIRDIEFIMLQQRLEFYAREKDNEDNPDELRLQLDKKYNQTLKERDDITKNAESQSIWDAFEVGKARASYVFSEANKQKEMEAIEDDIEDHAEDEIAAEAVEEGRITEEWEAGEGAVSLETYFRDKLLGNFRPGSGVWNESELSFFASGVEKEKRQLIVREKAQEAKAKELSEVKTDTLTEVQKQEHERKVKELRIARLRTEKEILNNQRMELYSHIISKLHDSYQKKGRAALPAYYLLKAFFGGTKDPVVSFERFCQSATFAEVNKKMADIDEEIQKLTQPAEEAPQQAEGEPQHVEEAPQRQEVPVQPIVQEAGDANAQQ